MKKFIQAKKNLILSGVMSLGVFMSLIPAIADATWLDLYPLDLEAHLGNTISYPEMKMDQSTILLARLESDAGEGVSELKIVVDSENRIQQITYNLENEKEELFHPSELKNEIVLLRRMGFKILRLASSDFSAEHGGQLEMIYMQNGWTGKYEPFKMDLVKTEQGWVLKSSSGIFTSMTLVANRNGLGHVVGIKSIETH